MRTRVTIEQGKFHINDEPTYQGVTFKGGSMEGRLFNVRMVNCTFDDQNPLTRPAGFDPDKNTERFLAAIDEYYACGIRAFTLNLQGGMPGYEGAHNSAFGPDGELDRNYLRRVERVLDACDARGLAVILGLFYQRQSGIFTDDDAVRRGVRRAVEWIGEKGYTHVLIEIANEYSHRGFKRPIIRADEGQVELIGIARSVHPGLLVSTSGTGSGKLPPSVAEVCDFLLIHGNNITPEACAQAVEPLLAFGKPVVFNEDSSLGSEAARTLELVALAGGSWGYMNEPLNQRYPFRFGIAPGEDALVYRKFAEVTGSPPPKVAEDPRPGQSEPGAGFALHLTITAPLDGAVVQGEVVWEAAVSDPGAFARAEFFVDGRRVDVREELPCRFRGATGKWDASGLEPGMHTLRIVAYDKDGASREASINVIVEA